MARKLKREDNRVYQDLSVEHRITYLEFIELRGLRSELGLRSSALSHHHTYDSPLILGGMA